MANRTTEEERIAQANARMGHVGNHARMAVPELSEDSYAPLTLARLADAHEALANAIEAAMLDDRRNEEELGEARTIFRSLKRLFQKVEEAET